MNNVEVLIKNREIVKKTKYLAKLIDEKYKNEPIVLICVLKGAVVFYNLLLKYIKNENVEFDFIQVKSYCGTQSTGKIELKKDIDCNVENKNVILVEDIVDTGLTANYLFDIFKNRGAKNILMCTLLFKPSKLKTELNISILTGFQIEDSFVFGFGLDVDEKYRNYKDILVLKRGYQFDNN